jgi:glycogen operon protein
VFQRRRWFKGRALRGRDVADIAWFRFDGEEMSEEDWGNGFAKSLAVFLNGEDLRDVDAEGNRLRDDSFLLVFNAHHDQLTLTLPSATFGKRWEVVVDTNVDSGESEVSVAAGESIEIPPHSMLVLARPLLAAAR